MSEAIKPDKITKPIQLLGAWLAGLLAIDTCFLHFASQMPIGALETRVLIGAAVCNVPLFLAAVFLLQTKFRPEMQEDSYYASYLNRKTNVVVTVNKEEAQLSHFQKKLQEIEGQLVDQPSTVAHQFSSLVVGVHKSLPDLRRISDTLFDAGIVGFRTFGASEVPEHRMVAISPNLDKSTLMKVLSVARDLGFEQYSYINPIEEIPEDVLFGAYGDPEYQIAGAKSEGT